MSVAIRPADLDALTAEQLRMPGVRLWVAEREDAPGAPLLGSGATRVSLETGVVPIFDAARSLDAAAGFTPCAPFGAYRPDRHSTFLTQEL